MPHMSRATPEKAKKMKFPSMPKMKANKSQIRLQKQRAMGMSK